MRTQLPSGHSACLSLSAESEDWEPTQQPNAYAAVKPWRVFTPYSAVKVITGSVSGRPVEDYPVSVLLNATGYAPATGILPKQQGC